MHAMCILVAVHVAPAECIAVAAMATLMVLPLRERWGLGPFWRARSQMQCQQWHNVVFLCIGVLLRHISLHWVPQSPSSFCIFAQRSPHPDCCLHLCGNISGVTPCMWAAAALHSLRSWSAFKLFCSRRASCVLWVGSLAVPPWRPKFLRQWHAMYMLYNLLAVSADVHAPAGA